MARTYLVVEGAAVISPVLEIDLLPAASALITSDIDGGEKKDDDTRSERLSGETPHRSDLWHH
jgi:hypothetical protein